MNIKDYKETKEGRKERIKAQGNMFRSKIIEDKKKKAQKNICRNYRFDLTKE